MTKQQQITDGQPGESVPGAAISDPAQGAANSLLSNLGYFRRYGEHLADLDDNVKAWERTEADLQTAFGLRRFASYGSFKVTFCNLQKAKKNARQRVTFFFPR